MPGERRIAKKNIGPSTGLFIAVSILICDQITKFIVQGLIPLDTSIPIIKDLFHLTLVFNRGAAFGIFKAQTAFFIAIAVATIIFIIYYFPRLKKDEIFIKLGLASILGGVLGNLIDRLRFGYVIDFLDFRIWPVFNIADSAITIGAILLVMQLVNRKP